MNDFPQGPDGRQLKLLVLGSESWAAKARDLGVHALYLPGPLSQAAAEATVEQEGCHGLISDGRDYDLGSTIPCWQSDADPKGVVAYFQSGPLG